MGGMIEQVTDQAAGVVDNAEQSAMSSMGNGSKLLSGFAGSSGSQSGQAGNAGTAGDGKGQEKKGGQEGGKSQGGGDFLSLLKSGVHTRLMTFGLMNIRKLGARVIAAGAAKVTGVIKKMLTPKVKFKLGAEEHELWVEKGKNRNVVMMASKNPAPIKVKIQEGEMTNNGEVNNKCEKIESEKDDQKVVQQNEVLADTIQAVTAGVSEANPKTRLPRTDGRWEGEPGNGKWYSTKPKVLKVTKGEPVVFKNGRPNFTSWSVGSLIFKKGELAGTREDFGKVYEYLKEKYKFNSKNEAKNWLRDNGLTPHHLSDTEIQLVPTDLNDGIPHIGSASDMRGGF